MNKKTRIIALFAVAFLVLNGALALVYGLLLAPEHEQLPATVAIDAEAQQLEQMAQAKAFDDHYYSIHFNEGDAIEVCEREARSRNNNVIQLSVDKLSTRFVEVAEQPNYYLVKLNSLVGTAVLYDEKSHECQVDPTTDGVAFYREIMKRRAVRPGG
jgi:hypothetical protein